jgi:hypothetical protein
MQTMPAYCSSCQSWHQLPMEIQEGSIPMTFENSGGYCPKCGTRTRVPDGTYQMRDGVMQAIASYDLTRSELKKLTQVIQRALDNSTPAGEVRQIIEKEFPKATGLAKFIFEGWNLPLFVTLLISLLCWYYPISPTNGPIKTPDANRQVDPVVVPKRAVRRNRAKQKRGPKESQRKQK